MIKAFYFGFNIFIASTVLFILAILTPFWIIKTSPLYRGIFEVCLGDSSEFKKCGYILTYSDTIQAYRQGEYL